MDMFTNSESSDKVQTQITLSRGTKQKMKVGPQQDDAELFMNYIQY